MTEDTVFQEKYYTSHNGLKLYYRDYCNGGSDKTPLLCLHGLTRNAKDFDRFARHFASDRRVISLDMRGRGKSAYDPNYKNYQIPVYGQDVLSCLAQEGLDQVIAVGTSMGGLISMAIGAAKPCIFKAIILNDIGPEINPEGLKRIAGFVGNGITLPNWNVAIMGIKALCSPLFPDYQADDWELFTRNTFRELDDGTIIADYDQAIGTAMKEATATVVPVDLWNLFKDIGQIPVMTLRGENSDILSHETLERMAQEHPQFTPLTVPDRAHTPDLNEDISLREIRQFIDQV
ncbi:MAG: alpha/beta hydrolase [Alphaproteobacteria bacterium]|nr:MAG: alpha/beta hydrolase [Alphaproteobacteria bacterium]